VTVEPSTLDEATVGRDRPDVADTPEGRPWSNVIVFGVLVGASLAAALLAASAVLEATGNQSGTVFSAMVRGSVGSVAALAATLNHTTILLIVAVGAAIAGRAGLINIGLEGQLAFGAMLGAAVGLATPAPGWLLIPLIVLTATAGGALWASVAAFLKYKRRISEVITTLLLNFLAFQILSFAVNRSWLLQESPGATANVALSPQSDRLPVAARLPSLASGQGFRLHIGIVIAVLVALAAAFLIARTIWGFRIRMVGLNPRASKRFGVSVVMIGGGALVLSGALAGLAGGVLLSGQVLRIQTGFANNYGWQGLLVALVAGFRPLYAIPVAFLYGALRAGGGVLAAKGVDQALVLIVQALILLAVTLPSLYMVYRDRRRQARLVQDRT
jgi:general nucleoside transport system permease protein